MTEQEWLNSTDPAGMLRCLTGYEDRAALFRGSTTSLYRKIRLFACGCCRLVWDGEKKCSMCKGFGDCYYVDGGRDEDGGKSPDLCIHKTCPDCQGTGCGRGITDPRSRRAVEVAEQIADGLPLSKDTDKAQDDAEAAFRDSGRSFEAELAMLCLTGIPRLLANAGLPRWFSVSTKQAAAQADLLRCVAGNPFRSWMREDDFAIGNPLPGKKLSLLWLSWITTDTLATARTAYDERDWSLLPVLADALEDGGCDSADLLTHLRGPGPHCRGCWAVDLILGKE